MCAALRGKKSGRVFSALMCYIIMQSKGAWRSVAVLFADPSLAEMEG